MYKLATSSNNVKPEIFERLQELLRTMNRIELTYNLLRPNHEGNVPLLSGHQNTLFNQINEYEALEQLLEQYINNHNELMSEFGETFNQSPELETDDHISNTINSWTVAQDINDTLENVSKQIRDLKYKEGLAGAIEAFTRQGNDPASYHYANTIVNATKNKLKIHNGGEIIY